MARKMKNCPYCGEEVLAVAKKCKHCGEWFEPTPNTKECPFCGMEMPIDSTECPHCEETIVYVDGELSCGFGYNNPYVNGIKMTTEILMWLTIIALILGKHLLGGSELFPFYTWLLIMVLAPICVYLGVFFVLYIYLLPSIAAKAKNHSDLGSILLINILTGFTIIGWILCFVWVGNSDSDE